MKSYKLYNNIAGWAVWIIASITYLLTIEPTTSFWDCGEFIATASKLEVGHPPGAPLFMILGRFFSLFSFGDVSKIAMMVNIMSALASSFTILFLFWTITHLAKKLIVKAEDITLGHSIAIIGSGIVGSLAYAFSDTFWFSAVEAEVYASSSLFTALVFWAILKWENVAEQQYANRWIIFIAFLVGLSIGVHLLNLLAIPAIVFVYYFKKYDVSFKGIIIAALLSVVLLGAIMYGIIPGIVTVASWFELLFVNSMGMGYNTGLIVFAILLIGGIVVSIYYSSREENKKVWLTAAAFVLVLSLTGIPFMGGAILFVPLFGGIIAGGIFLARKKKEVINTIVLGITVILIGYSSFTMIVIRSFADPPMDENNPENVFSLLSYLNREQYGDRPLFYGQYFNAPLDRKNSYSEGDPAYIKKDGMYVIADIKETPNYDEKFCSVIPRMYSPQQQHIQDYLWWTGTTMADFYNPRLDDEGNIVTDRSGIPQYDMSSPKKKPSFSDNLKFLFRYQVGYMYMRYFMWNFAGRQNDIQGHKEVTNGNWISGIDFIDNSRLGDQNLLPSTLKENKANNQYYFLPLIFGLLGLLYHLLKKPKDFTLVLLLFLFTGLAIVFYLNQYPHQPRERDYAYAGSFYAFAIWIGLGVLALIEASRKFIPLLPSAALFTAAGIILVPGIMVGENWDDHDRSNRYTALDFATNYLNSCAPNAILFTNGDNDTFPLWYAQEVEGIRTDVRVINLSLLNTDWYITQMKRKAYDSDPVPFSMSVEKITQGTRDYAPVTEMTKSYTNIKEVLEFVASDDERVKRSFGGDEKINYIPTKKIIIPVDSAKVVSNGTVRPEQAGNILKEMKWDLNKNYLLKGELMILDLLATNNWERPVYFAITVGNDSYLNLQKYFQLEGLAYRLVPLETKNPDRYQIGKINSDIMYDNMMNKFRWGGINDNRVYLDENILRMTMNFRNNFSRLAEELHKEGKNDSALAVLDRCIEIMPDSLVPYNYFNIAIAEAYENLGEREKAREIISILTTYVEEELKFYFSLDPEKAETIEEDKQRSLSVFYSITQWNYKIGNTDEGNAFIRSLTSLIEKELDKVFSNKLKGPTDEDNAMLYLSLMQEFVKLAGSNRQEELQAELEKSFMSYYQQYIELTGQF